MIRQHIADGEREERERKREKEIKYDLVEQNVPSDYHYVDGNQRKMIDKAQGFSSSQLGWSPPETDMFKTNFGVAINTSKGWVGVGIIVRNSDGEVIAYCSQRTEAFANKKVTNLIAIQRGLLYGIECGLNPEKIESDDSIVVNWIVHGVYRDSDFGTILTDIDADNCFIFGTIPA
ncbi:hypothetical protein Ddye_011912 [Dipteronia dyeriana]|uniref:RNase H type-1 domain-containing protein n=1 Tax=Dipteronia dyeriana TaxID=168575 RepID=A0AAD9X3E2_9ROSI|nr:hypothetical protein Ddye_011912 [Dipteronia dyeriana]